MRNGDVYKIKSLHRTGATDKEIVQYMSRKYGEAEVRRFIPGAAERVAAKIEKAAKVKQVEQAEEAEPAAETEPKKQVTRGKKKSKAKAEAE